MGRVGMMYSNQRFKINLSQSYNFLTDYIMGINNSVIPPMNFYTNGLRVFQNVPGAKLLSTDLQSTYSPMDGLYFFNLTKFTWGRLDSDEPLPLIPPLKNVISVSYEKRQWTFRIDNESSLRQNRINLQYGETISPSYSIFNFKSSYHFMFSDSMLDVSTGITNLFNAVYYEHLDWGRIYRPGRSIDIFLKYTY